jgi:hypothetical protein
LDKAADAFIAATPSIKAVDFKRGKRGGKKEGL